MGGGDIFGLEVVLVVIFMVAVPYQLMDCELTNQSRLNFFFFFEYFFGLLWIY